MNRRLIVSLGIVALIQAAGGRAQTPQPSPPRGVSRPGFPARDQSDQKKGTGRISGRVVAADSGALLRRQRDNAIPFSLKEGETKTVNLTLAAESSSP